MSKSFEENMEELEKVVAELEKGDLNLDDSVSRFEQGSREKNYDFSKKR